MPSKSKRTLQSNILPGRTFPCEERCEACLDVAALDDKVATLQPAIAELEAERVSLLSKVNHRHDLLTNCLPIELFTKILELALPIPDTRRNDSSRLEILGPLVFSAVSRRWRALVYSIPSLWAVVPIYREGGFPRVMEELMETWLSRSGQSPLSIVIDIDDPAPPQFLSRILYYCSHRLEYLRFEGEHPLLGVFRSVNSSGRENAVLALRTLPNGAIRKSTELKLLRGSEPTLELKFILALQIVISVDTTRLTHVNLSWPPMSACMDLLAWFPMVVDLSVYGISESRHSYTTTKPPTIHRALRYLRVSFESDILCEVLNRLTAPSLQHLELNLWASDAAGSSRRVLLDGIVHCLQRSSAGLEYLSIQDLSLRSSDKAYPSLRTLIGTVGPSIRHLVIGVIPRGRLASSQPEAPQQLINSIFNDQNPLPHLQSVTFDAIDSIWLHYLKALLVSISRFMSANGIQPITLVMRFGSNPLNTEDEESVLPDIYRNGTLLLPGPEIAEMLSLRERSDITIKILVTGQRGENDVSNKVLGVLTRMSRGE